MSKDSRTSNIKTKYITGRQIGTRVQEGLSCDICPTPQSKSTVLVHIQIAVHSKVLVPIKVLVNV